MFERSHAVCVFFFLKTWTCNHEQSGSRCLNLHKALLGLLKLKSSLRVHIRNHLVIFITSVKKDKACHEVVEWRSINTESMMALWNLRIRIQSGMEIRCGSRIKKCVGCSKIQEWGLPEEWEFHEVHEVGPVPEWVWNETWGFGQVPEWGLDVEWGFLEVPEWGLMRIKKGMMIFWGSRMRIKWGLKEETKIWCFPMCDSQKFGGQRLCWRHPVTTFTDKELSERYSRSVRLAGPELVESWNRLSWTVGSGFSKRDLSKHAPSWIGFFDPGSVISWMVAMP